MRKLPIRSEKRRQALDEGRKKAKERADARQADVIEVPRLRPNLPEKVDPTNLPPRRALGRPKGQKHLAKCMMPACPHCDGFEVRRAGFARGRQVYMCTACDRRFMGRGFKVRPLEKIVFMCYRCGGTNVDNLGMAPMSGRLGFCKKCRKRFIQGGRNELVKYHLLLKARVEEMGLPRDVREEMLQIAYKDVLEGKGYCWTVALNRSAAWSQARGDLFKNRPVNQRDERKIWQNQRG